MRVLVVDDSEADRRLLRYYLKRAGWETVEAQNGREAMERIRENPPDLIISDALMPEMDGFQLLREVKKMRLSESIPFIVYSSTYMEYRDQELARSLGADAFIVKAKEHDEFWQELNRALENRKNREVTTETIDEEQYLSKYSTVLLMKLEQKVNELEQAKARMEETEKKLEQDISQRRILMAQVHYLNEELEKRTALHDAPAVQTRQELERLSPTFFHDLFAPLREIERLSGEFLKKHPDVGTRVREELDHLLLTVRSIPGLLEELLDLPKIPRIRLHEPVKKIATYLHMLDTELAGSEAEFTGRLRREADRMRFFIDDLLDLIRVLHVEIRTDTVDLARLVREIEGELRKSQPERSVEFVIPERLPVRADRHLIRIVLENLLEHAWRSTVRSPHAAIEFGVIGREDGPEYFIRDNGPGFEKKNAEFLFVPFRGVRNAQYLPATGIGLAIVKSVIDRHGGAIRVESEPGKGATFVFTLPQDGSR